MASTDLTSKIAPFLDRHLVFPLLEFLQDRQIYPEEEILTAKIELLGRTNMVDYAMDIHKSLHHSEEVPPAMVERRGEVVSRLKTLEEAAAPLVAFLQNPATVQELRSDKAYNLLMLQEKYQVRPTEARTAPRWDNSTSRRCFSLRVPSSFSRRPPLPRRLSPPSFRSFRASVTCRSRSSAPSSFPLPLPPAQIGAEGVEALCWYAKFQFECGSYSGAAIGAEGVEALYWYAKFQFECGNYSGAADFLYQYRLLCSSPQRALSASWGKLAAELLMQNWDAAGEELARVKEMIDSQTFASPLAVLQERTWLLHWALFAMLHSENGRSNLVDLFLQDKTSKCALPRSLLCLQDNAIQTNAQHLLLYLVAAVLTCTHCHSAVKEVTFESTQKCAHMHALRVSRRLLRRPCSKVGYLVAAVLTCTHRHSAVKEVARVVEDVGVGGLRPAPVPHPLSPHSSPILSLLSVPFPLPPPLPPPPSPPPPHPPIRYLSAIQANAQHLLRYLVAAVLTCKPRPLFPYAPRPPTPCSPSRQTNAQHLLRYLVAAVLTCKRRRSAVKEVARVVEAERHAYSDPLTQFLLALVVDLDFDEAQSRLKECEELLSNVFFLGKRMAEGGRVRGPQLLSNDFFLGKRVAEGGYVAVPLRDEVIDSARLLMFENYCSIHRRIDINARLLMFENYCSIHRRIDIKVVAEKKSMATDAAELWMVVAEKLSMATDAAERWMANLIRTAKLDATIDSEAGTLVMATAQPNVYVAGHGYENLIERSRGLTSRTYALASNVAAIALQQ
ncbi:unnamed protein product [Closterium sp. NIES-65]|nr:unnamed protein product [Closterium sp. NIES-65]